MTWHLISKKSINNISKVINKVSLSVLERLTCYSMVLGSFG
jgi:hypothetical protein